MANAVRKYDVTHGHPRHGSIVLDYCTGDVAGNGKTIGLKGDKCLNGGDHGQPIIETCSSSVRINGRGVARINDRLTCGDTFKTGSPDIQVGG